MTKTTGYGYPTVQDVRKRVAAIGATLKREQVGDRLFYTAFAAPGHVWWNGCGPTLRAEIPTSGEERGYALADFVQLIANGYAEL